MKKLKSVIAALLCAALLLGFAGCSQSDKTALNISGAEINYETFLYYLDTVYAFPEKYGLEKDPTEDELISTTIELCCEYVAVNTKLEQEQLILTTAEKRAASDSLEDIWHVFSAYYENLGISKQTLMKIQTSDAARNRLFYFVFDNGGERAVNEEDVKKYYNENYISFRAINGYLTTTDESGNTVVMTADQKAEMNKEFTDLESSLNNGQTMSEVVEKYVAKHPTVTASEQLQFIKKGTGSYPDGFFEEVSKLKTGACKVIIMDEYIFLVLKDEPEKEESEQYYARYRDDCLKSLHGDEFDEIVKGYTEGLKVERNDRVIRKALKEVRKDG